MSLSGVTTYSMTASDIVTKVFRLLDVYGPGSSIPGEDFSTAFQTLNMMVKAWQSPQYGFHMWKQKECICFINPGQQFYQLGGSTPDRVGLGLGHNTALTAALVATNTSLVVVATAGMTVGDNIGIELDDGSLQWTTIATITSTTTLTISAGVTKTSAIGNNIFTYTTAAGRPLEIENVRLLKNNTTTMRMNRVAKQMFFNIPNINSVGQPIQYFEDRQLNQTNLWVYGTGSSSQDALVFTSKQIIEDFSISTNIADFPQTWMACLVFNLAVWLSPEYGKEDKVAAGIAAKADELFQAASSWDQESARLKISPYLGNY